MDMHYANISGVRRFAKWLTQLQILQLLKGIAMNVLSYRNAAQSSDPEQYQRDSLVNGALCLSYALMFLQFYASKYSSKTKSSV